MIKNTKHVFLGRNSFSFLVVIQNCICFMVLSTVLSLDQMSIKSCFWGPYLGASKRSQLLAVQKYCFSIFWLPDWFSRNFLKICFLFGSTQPPLIGASIGSVYNCLIKHLGYIVFDYKISYTVQRFRVNNNYFPGCPTIWYDNHFWFALMGLAQT